MIEIFLQLLEKLIEFRQKVTEDERTYFTSYVQPTYEAAETIYRDYRSLLGQARRKITRCKTLAPVSRLLEQRREDYRPLRMRVRAMLEVRDDSWTQFERGVLALMTGSMSSFEDRHFYVWPISVPTP